MNVVVKRAALEQFLKDIVLEDRSHRSARIDYIAGHAGSDDQTPIEPSEQIPTQLSHEKPPVEDEEFVPTGARELERAVAALSEYVPKEEIEGFYNDVKKAVVYAVDRKNDSEREEVDFEEEDQKKQEEIAESILLRSIDRLLEVDDDWGEPTEDDLQDIEKEETGFSDVDYSRSFGNLPAEVREKIQDVVDIILRKEYHLVLVPGGQSPGDDYYSAMSQHGPSTQPSIVQGAQGPELGKKVEKVLASDSVADEIVYQAVINDTEVRDSLTSLVNLIQIPPMDAIVLVALELSRHLGKDEKIISQDLATEMFANKFSDKMIKQSESDMEKYSALMDAEIARLQQSPKATTLGKGIGERQQKDFDLLNADLARYLEAAKERTLGGVGTVESTLDDTGLPVDPDGSPAEDTTDALFRRRLENLEDNLDALAPFFGFSGASGLRQWISKFPSRKYRVLIGGEVGVEPRYKRAANIFKEAMEAIVNSGLVYYDSKNKKITDQLASASGKKKKELQDMQTLMTNFVDDFQKMSDQIEEDDIDMGILTTRPGGFALRFALGSLVLDPVFREYHTAWAEQAEKIVADMSTLTNEKDIRYISKMLTGETDTPTFNEKLDPKTGNVAKPVSSSAKKALKLGVDESLFNKMLKASTEWSHDYFHVIKSKSVDPNTGKSSESSEDNFKKIRAEILKRTSSQAKLKGAFEKAISEYIEEIAERQVFRNLQDEFGEEAVAQAMSETMLAKRIMRRAFTRAIQRRLIGG